MSDLPPAGAPLQLAQRPASLTLSVYHAIRQAIIDGRIPAATRVTEAALARQLNVSKTPVREALLRLKEVGLIEADGSRAGRILTPSFEHTRDAYELRESLEVVSARLAAQRGEGSALLLARREANATVVAAGNCDIAGYREADQAFHAAVAAAGGNRMLARAIDDINALISALRQRAIPGVDASVVCASQHVGIVEAILAADVSGAERLMSEHVRHVGTQVLEAFRTAG